MRQKILSIALVVLMLTTIPVRAADNTLTNAEMRMQPLIKKLNTYTPSDVNTSISRYTDLKTHWSRTSVAKLTLLGMLSPVKGMFNPDAKISVAEYLRMTVLALGYKISPSISIKTNWYDSYVKQALSDKLIDLGEYKDYTKTITREQAAKIIFRAAMLFQEAPDKNYYNIMKWRIKDYARITDKYKDSFVKAYILGYFTLGKLATCDPQGSFTNAQAAILTLELIDANARTKFVVMEDEYFLRASDLQPNGDGSGIKYYPIDNTETAKVYNVLLAAIPQDKGYVSYGAGPVSASLDFYDSQRESEINSLYGDQGNIHIDNHDYPKYTNYPYDCNIINMSKIKDLHYNSFIVLFNYLFEKDSYKAIAELNKAFSNTAIAGVKEFKFNERYLYLTNVGNGLTIYITFKGGLSAKAWENLYL